MRASEVALDRFLRMARGFFPDAPLFLLIRRPDRRGFGVVRCSDGLLGHLSERVFPASDRLVVIATAASGPVRVPSLDLGGLGGDGGESLAGGDSLGGKESLADALRRAGVQGLWLLPLGPVGDVDGFVGVCDRPSRELTVASDARHPLSALRELWAEVCGAVGASQEAVVSAIGACISESLVVVDRAGRVTQANDAALLLLGLGGSRSSEGTLEEVERRLGSLVFRDDSGEEYTWLNGPLAWALEGRRIHALEVSEVGGGAERRLRLASSRIPSADGEDGGAVIAFRDLTAMRALRLKLEGTVEVERRRSSQLRALNQFAVTVNSETDPGRILDEVLGTALRLTRSAVGAVYRPSRGDLRLEAFVTIPELSEAPHGAMPGRMELKELARRTAEGRVAVRLAEEVAPGGGFLGYLGVPLVTGPGDLIACVALTGSPHPIGFTAEDEVLAMTLAAHAGVALENLRRLAREREVAHYLQRAMLPGDIRVPGLLVDHVYRSATDAALVGGDFYDVIPLSDTRVAVVVGDVCGKGLPAATHMSFVRHTLRAQAALGLGAGPWLEAANATLASDADTGSFVTVVMVVIDTVEGAAECALAGHHAPLLSTKTGIEVVEGVHGLPLGVDPSARYVARRFSLGTGETLCLFTDGVLEARRAGVQFGESRLSEALAVRVEGPFEGSAASLVDDVTEYAGERLIDDVVVMLVRLSGENSPRRRRLSRG